MVALTLPWLPSWAPVAVAIVACLLYYAYRLALPKPLAGIPHNKAAATKILGDLHEMIAVRDQGKGFRPWLGEMAYRHNSPIMQLFTVPFGRPWILLVDYHEAHDVVSRRTREFDRSSMTDDIFGPIIPNHHIVMPSSDPRYKRNKELVRDLMTPSFLNQVSGPSIYSVTEVLVDMWTIKAKIAQGRPFSAFEDVHSGALDIILAVSFGLGPEHSTTQAELDTIQNRPDLEIPANADKPVEFPRHGPSPQMKALITVTQTLELTMQSPLAWPVHWVLKKTKWRKAFKLKEQFITEQINSAASRLSGQDDIDGTTTCAMDHMILREVAAAKKGGRLPDFEVPLRDELFGYIIGGHDTSATTITWVLKYLTDNEAVQARLRQQLHRAFDAALTEKRHPTVTEITKTTAPYLDAFLEESFRHSMTLPNPTRQAIVDTNILGYHVPKGTHILMYTAGPSIKQPAVSVPDGRRSETSLATKERIGDWDPETIHLFEPQRWLTPKEGATAESEDFDDFEFNPQAGPFLSFGGGPRGCFGKRLAYLELRIVVALLVWNFEFGQCPPELSSYDGIDVLTTYPKYCYVRLKHVGPV